MNEPKQKIIDCCRVWWEIATTDTENVSEKFEIRVTVNIDGVPTVFTANPTDVLRILCDKFTFYKLPYMPFSSENVNDAIPVSNDFYNWKTRNYVNLERIVLAYKTKYNPIHNYDSELTVTDNSETETPYTKTKTITGKVKTGQDVEQFSKSGGIVQNDDKTFTDTENKLYETSFDSTSDPGGAKLKDRNTQAPIGGYGRTTVNPENNFQQWDGYTETETETGGKIHAENRKGNIGVTTTQHMIEKELELRKHDILVDFLYQYVFDNLFM